MRSVEVAVAAVAIVGILALAAIFGIAATGQVAP